MRERLVLQDTDAALERVALDVLVGTQCGCLGPSCELAVRGELQRCDLLAGELSDWRVGHQVPRGLVQTELDLAQLAVTPLRWSQPADHAFLLAARIVDDDLDRVDAVGRAFGGPAAPARKLGQVDARSSSTGSWKRGRTRRRSRGVSPSRSSRLIVTRTHPDTSRPARYAVPTANAQSTAFAPHLPLPLRRHGQPTSGSYSLRYAYGSSPGSVALIDAA
jgi:hypothetical protein